MTRHLALTKPAHTSAPRTTHPGRTEGESKHRHNILLVDHRPYNFTAL